MSETSQALATRFVGRRARLFGLVMITGFLTVLTLGVYRFWGKTRLRRWYWSAIRPGGQPLEYTGDGTEKLAGFFLAVSVLAFWLGVVNLLLMFASLMIWAVPGVAYAMSTLGLVPIWFFARYRARAYVLARTRWRAIRFGMAPGAWGYALRAVWHWVLTILTLGILWPRMTFKLEKFKTDRTWFGTQRMHQGGRWQMLWPAFAHVFVAGVLSLAAVGVAVTELPGAVWLLGLLGPWFLYGLVHYRVRSLTLMANAKEIGGARLSLEARPSEVARIVGFGAIAMAIVLLLPLALLGGSAFALQNAGLASAADLALMPPLGWVAVGGAVVAYFLFFLLWIGLRHILITMPVLRHYAGVFHLKEPQHLAAIGQRDKAKAGEAGGFAEALDLGAAI